MVLVQQGLFSGLVHFTPAIDVVKIRGSYHSCNTQRTWLQGGKPSFRSKAVCLELNTVRVIFTEC
jgi:hypothetical protein